MDFFDNAKIDRVFDLLIVCLLVAILGFISFFSFFKEDNREIVSDIEDKIAINDTGVENDDVSSIDKHVDEEIFYYVDIKGAVKKPGVYKVTEDAIINDVIKLAGGLKSSASTKYINLSKKVSDEMVINVYTTSQVSKMNNPSSDTCKVSNEVISDCENSSVIEIDSFGGNKNGTNENENTTKISINTASKEQLMMLDGVGEAKALAIIEYRSQNNGFKTLDEIMKVSGIGEAAYNKIKDNITL